MQILSLETSSETGSCALWRDGTVIEKHCPAGRSHSETLLPLVRELLTEAGASIATLDAIAFGAGPGAFTGLRVACGAAQGLAVAGNLPLIPVCGLAAMAAASGGRAVLALLDARMGEVYSGFFVAAGADGDWQQQGDICVTAPADVALPPGGDWLLCGNGLSAYPLLAERALAAGWALRPEIVPQAAWVARLAAIRLLRGEVVDPALAAPLYVRDKVAKTVAERLREGGRA